MDILDLNKDVQLKEITNALYDFGIMPNLRGFGYLRNSIFMCVCDERYLSSITKSLYIDVGNMNNTNSKNVERDIRHAIVSAWERNLSMDKIPRVGNYPFGKRPTNSQFIASVVDYLKVFNS